MNPVNSPTGPDPGGEGPQPAGPAPQDAAPPAGGPFGSPAGSRPSDAGSDVFDEQEPDADGGPGGGEVVDQVAQELAEQVDQAAEVVEDDLEVARLARERDEYLDALRRLQADFDNYRKRIIRQQTEHLERAAEGLVEKILPVLDAFDLALSHGEGFDQVFASLTAALEKEGLERIHPEGETFDPNEHDAVIHEAGEGPGGEPEVAEVMRPGYRWKGRVLRPAMVKVRG